MTQKIFESYKLGPLTLTNRIVMAPLTRRRATAPELKANDLMALYYRQRSSAGLIVAEGSQVSPEGYGFTGSPGCYSRVQTEAWKKVTRAVHEEGGRIFLQLWHVGPWSHRLLQPEGKPPLSASVVVPVGEVLTPGGRLPYEPSRSMTVNEIHATIKDFGLGARNAMEAGFDGVEVHGAHSYIIDQFIMDGTNKRNDEFGGSLENRSRFLFMVLDEVMQYVPADEVGLRLSPRQVKIGMADSKPEDTYGYIVNKLNSYKLAYLHISEMMTQGERLGEPERTVLPLYREIYDGRLISCGGHSRVSALQMIDSGYADMVAFGKPFISNPDLVDRLKSGNEPTEPDKDTFYHGGPRGYVDYPAMDSEAQA